MSAQPILLKFKVAFDEADGEGIVFFGNYFRLAHRALEHFLPQAGIPWDEWFKNKEWGVPLRHVEADYMKPLRPGDEYVVQVAVVEMGDSSVHFSYEMQDLKNTPLARLKTSHVFVTRLGEMKRTRVPDHIRARLEPFLKK